MKPSVENIKKACHPTVGGLFSDELGGSII